MELKYDYIILKLVKRRCILILEMLRSKGFLGTLLMLLSLTMSLRLSVTETFRVYLEKDGFGEIILTFWFGATGEEEEG